MPKDLVQISVPTVYRIEAGTEQEAAQEALQRYKYEHPTWIDPIVKVAEIKK